MTQPNKISSFRTSLERGGLDATNVHNLHDVSFSRDTLPLDQSLYHAVVGNNWRSNVSETNSVFRYVQQDKYEHLQRGCHRIMASLIDNLGLNIEARNAEGCTLLHIACEKGDVAFVKHLLVNCGANIYSRDYNGRTALQRVCLRQYLCSMGDIAICQLLLRIGASIDEITPINTITGDTLLHHVARSDYFLRIEDILDNIEGIDVNSKNRKGETALTCLIIHQNSHFVEKAIISLLKHPDIDCNGKTSVDSDYTLVEDCIMKHYIAAVEIMLTKITITLEIKYRMIAILLHELTVYEWERSYGGSMDSSANVVYSQLLELFTMVVDIPCIENDETMDYLSIFEEAIVMLKIGCFSHLKSPDVIKFDALQLVDMIYQLKSMSKEAIYDPLDAHNLHYRLNHPRESDLIAEATKRHKVESTPAPIPLKPLDTIGYSIHFYYQPNDSENDGNNSDQPSLIGTHTFPAACSFLVR